MPMRIFVDTEFTSLSNPRLISIGAVSEQGHEFYGIVTDFQRRSCTQFVADHVLPVLDAYPAHIKGTRDQVASAFRAWLCEHSGNCDELVILADDECDIELLRELVRGLSVSARLALLPIKGDSSTERRFNSYFEATPGGCRHNALDDARAYKAAVTAGEPDASGPVEGRLR